jgi:protein-disulfide isomerase
VAPIIEELYVETGIATFEFRDFAFLGDGSVLAAEANRCAADQGKFWEYHDLLMYNIDNPALDGATRPTFDALAEHLGLDMTEFGQCMDGRVHQAEVEQSRADASARGVTGTPTIALNEELVTGIQTYGELFDMIEELANQQQ